MGPRNVQRQGFVKTLRQLGRACGVPELPQDNNVSQGRVQHLARCILDHPDLTEEQRVAAVTAQQGYEATFAAQNARVPGDEAPGVEAQSEEQTPTVWQFKAAQLTYNHTMGEWASTDEVVLTALWERFKAFGIALAADSGALGVSMTMERSKRTDKHVHMHVYFHLKTKFRRRGRDALEQLAFENIRPHVTPNTASGAAYKGAVEYGHFYVFVDKIGSVVSWADYKPWEDYAVQGWWLDNLLKAGKLSRHTYLLLAAKVTIGFQKRLADARAAERFEQAVSVQAHVRREAARLDGNLSRTKDFPEVEKFVSMFDTESFYHRRPILAIIGGTNLGKRLLGRKVLLRVAERLGLEEFLEVTVENMETIDVVDFDLRIHGGVLLDGIGDALTLKQNREALQGRPKVCKGAKSATNVYAYEYTFCRRGIVATFDLSAHNLDAFDTDHWLSNELNVIVLKLTEKAYDDAPVLPLQQRTDAPHGGTVESPQRKRRLAELGSEQHA